MDPVWLSLAFVLGLGARFVKLPPLVGYLVAGFILNALGAESGEFVRTVSDLGVTLLLFTIGLKLQIKSLLRPEIYAGATMHLLLMTGILGVCLWGMTFLGFTFFHQQDYRLIALIAFALSFSSTVFAVKVLEEKSEVNSIHGKTAIGVLIIQDIIAVVFLVFAAGKIPSPWALAIPAVLIAIRPLLVWILNKIGHGELLILYGFFLALVIGAELFHLVGLKEDLGALVVGMMLAPKKKAKEMSESLLQFKDFFLIGFFLSIGLSGQPDWTMVLIAVILALLINVKVLAYLFTFLVFRMRARTSVFTSLALANYSEFGLIVLSIGVSAGWIPSAWLIIVAIALSVSFMISSPLNSYAPFIYGAVKKIAHRYESKKRLTYDQTIDIGDAEILIFGMGRIGTSSYDHLNKKYGQKVLGLDYNPEVVEYHKKEGRRVVHDDATDLEFWERIQENRIHTKQVKLIILCMDGLKSNLFAAERLRRIDFSGNIAAIAKHEDEIRELQNKGIQAAYDLYAEAGIGFADHVCSLLKKE
ncbi:MAG: cation:proton antiporter family protein [Bacteroidota bacterium]